MWALFIPAPIAVGAAFLATLSFLRYRWLRGEPLPPQRSRAARRLPPWGSAARQPMAALAASERGLFSLLGDGARPHAARGRARELTAAANQTAATMAATANEVCRWSGRSVRHRSRGPIWRPRSPRSHAARPRCPSVQRNGHRRSTIGVSGQHRLDVGSPMSQQRYRDELVNATDRLLGWAQAFDELGHLRRA